MQAEHRMATMHGGMASVCSERPDCTTASPQQNRVTHVWAGRVSVSGCASCVAVPNNASTVCWQQAIDLSQLLYQLPLGVEDSTIVIARLQWGMTVRAWQESPLRRPRTQLVGTDAW